jgi:alpha-glucosidase/alpha-D-xyloside xylohydrolase
LKTNDWFIQKADGSPDVSWWGKSLGPDIDTTDPEAAKWFWSAIRDNHINHDGFNYIWLDETEPDIDTYSDYFHIGAGNRYYNVYPLFYTAAIYDGYRRDFGDSRRVMGLARAAYLGAQRNGTVFWSSDIMSTWDMLRRSITAGLNFTASGMPYWDTDIGGYARRPIHASYHPLHKPLVSPDGAEATVGDYSDFPELYVRWFEWSAFQPVMRAHGERKNNEVWSFGREATPILEKFLRLRYQLLPYTYSLAYGTYKTGSPFMRALWMDFPDDANVANISDEYMYGPALLVAPVSEQGATNRQVYLPAGCDWYDFWTNEKLRGGETVTATAPIDTIPLFVRAGSIIPLGSPVLDADQPQTIASVRVYPGASADFTLYSDDGQTYAYESGKCSITRLHWDEGSRQFSHAGAQAWTNSDAAVVDVIKPATGR